MLQFSFPNRFNGFPSNSHVVYGVDAEAEKSLARLNGLKFERL
jgi:hypothetical protein